MPDDISDTSGLVRAIKTLIQQPNNGQGQDSSTQPQVPINVDMEQWEANGLVIEQVTEFGKQIINFKRKATK